MKRFLIVIAVVGVVFGVGSVANADVWRWNDNFIAAFVDAEGINRHPGSSEQGEQFDGQMLGTCDVVGLGVDVYYDLVDTIGNPVDNSVAGLEVWKPNGADWLGQGVTSGLGLVSQWGKQLHMDASGLDSLELPLWYKSGQGPLDVRVFCVTGTSSGTWVETQMDSATVTLNQGESAILTVDLTDAPDRTRMVKVGVVVEAHDSTMLGKKATLHIGSVPVATVKLENYGPNSSYRWMDVADQPYSVAFQNSYTYDNANVQVTYNTVGQQLVGTLTATNLKPNFAYQFKLIGESTYKPGDANDGCNELIGLNGRWWEQEWTGSSWNAGWNLNNKGDGTSPNPNDNTYYARRNTLDSGSPTGLNYIYTGYRVFEYFITDENGSATLNYTVNNCYHVLFKTTQSTPGANDGPVVTRTFDVNPSIHTQYDTNYGEQTVSIFGEWERLPKNGVGLRLGDYTCHMLLTEESFHGSGLQGWWAHAMKGQVQFTVVSLGQPVVPNVVGMTQAAATTAITAVDNLTVGTVTQQYSNTVAAGLVISQNPAGGTAVPIGSSVSLVVSLGQPVVPNVVGMTQAAATTAITAVDNLTVGTVTQQYSNTVAAGLVISQSPAGGTAVPIGSSVNLVVSLGQPVVPSVVGMTQAAATTAITAVDNLTVGTVTQQYSNTVAAGLVISQSPAGGTAVPIGSSVNLVVSLGQPVVPSVVGMTQAAATTAITAVDNLTVGTVTQQYSNTVAAGLVISQSPVGGTKVPIGSTVNIVVSLGQPVVPNVVGMIQVAAITAIIAVDNLTVGTVTQQYSNTVAAGLVISQSPVGGTKVPIGSTVNIVVSLGQPVVPNVVGMIQIAAITAITAVDNLTVGTVTHQYSNTVAAGLVISQNPVGGTKVPIGSTVNIVVSLGQPIVPNVVGMTQAAATTAITAVDSLTVGTVTQQYSNTVAAGLVISQSPAGGTAVPIGSSVNLVVSLGQPVVPSVVGMTQAAATTAITAVDNLMVGTVTQQYSNTVAAGLVISQNPAGGTTVPIGSAVSIVVSLGQPVVPNVVGMTQAAATTAITAVDSLTVGTVTQQYSNTVAAGLVISQSPQGSTIVPINSSVDIKVSLGPPPAAIYVDDDAEEDSGPYDPDVSDPLEGGSAEHPFDMIQEAIEFSMEGLTIIVLEGAYYENIDFGGRNIALCSADPNDPNVVANTIIDGIRVGTVVTFVSGETANCLLTGFTITGGNAEFGGGIYCYNSSPTISKCVISGNWAGHGGGIYNHQSSPTLANCIFSGNRAIHYGGGIYNVDSNGTAVLTNCTLSGNSANSGGGIYNQSSYLLLTNSILWGNDDKGGTDESAQIDVNNNSVALVNYSCVQGWTGAIGGLGSFDADPCFAELGHWDDNSTPMYLNDDVWVNGDYHLKSKVGRWNPNTQRWVIDNVTSLCIDAGDPNSDWTAELWPNGKRINMGAYGGTPEASMSLSDVGNIANLNNDPEDSVTTDDLTRFIEDWCLGEAPLVSDLNRDSTVDFEDFAIFAENWLK